MKIEIDSETLIDSLYEDCPKCFRTDSYLNNYGNRIKCGGRYIFQQGEPIDIEFCDKCKNTDRVLSKFGHEIIKLVKENNV